MPGSVPGADSIHPCFFCRVPWLQRCAAPPARSPAKPATLLSRPNGSWRWRSNRRHTWMRQHRLTRSSGRSILGERPLRSTFVFGSVCHHCALSIFRVCALCLKDARLGNSCLRDLSSPACGVLRSGLFSHRSIAQDCSGIVTPELPPRTTHSRKLPCFPCHVWVVFLCARV